MLNGSTLKLERTLVGSARATSAIRTTSARYSTGKAAKMRDNMISSVVWCYNCWCCKISLQSQLTFSHTYVLYRTHMRKQRSLREPEDNIPSSSRFESRSLSIADALEPTCRETQHIFNDEMLEIPNTKPGLYDSARCCHSI